MPGLTINGDNCDSPTGAGDAASEHESPEWETANERTVKWNKEQSSYLLARLGLLHLDKP